jgi:hypothetical protein
MRREPDNTGMQIGIVGIVGRATACDAWCRGFSSRSPRGVAVDFGPELYFYRNAT